MRLKGFLNEGEATALALLARSGGKAKYLLKKLDGEAYNIAKSMCDYSDGKTTKLHPTAKWILEWADNEHKQSRKNRKVISFKDKLETACDKIKAKMTEEELESLESYACPCCGRHR